MSFKVGDRVEVVRVIKFSGWLGAVGTVEELSQLDFPEYGYPPGAPLCRVSITERGVWVPADCLAPWRDDGAEKGSWDELTRNLCRVKEKVET